MPLLIVAVSLGTLNARMSSWWSQVGNQPVVTTVRSNPEPDRHIAFDHGECAIAKPYSSREDWPSGVDLLEVEADENAPSCATSKLVRIQRLGLPFSELRQGFIGHSLERIGRPAKTLFPLIVRRNLSQNGHGKGLLFLFRESSGCLEGFAEQISHR